MERVNRGGVVCIYTGRNSIVNLRTNNNTRKPTELLLSSYKHTSEKGGGGISTPTRHTLATRYLECNLQRQALTHTPRKYEYENVKERRK